MKKYIAAFFAICISALLSHAQSNTSANLQNADTSSQNSDAVRAFAVSPKPTFDVNKYLRDGLKYPKLASDNYLEGTVVIQIIIDTNGKVIDAKPIKKKLGGGLTEEAVRVVKAMPDWTPAKNEEGRPIKLYYHIPVRFAIAGDDLVLASNALHLPVPAAGVDSLQKYIKSKMLFPQEARDKGLTEGFVEVRYVINEDGTVSNVIASTYSDEVFVEEAENIIKSMPKWIPAEEKRHHKIRCKNFTTLTFKEKK